MSCIDLNADLGESFGRWALGDDDALLRVVTSANIACGFHAGDPGVMRKTCERAVECGVAIGAHVAYRDLAGFGRRYLDVSPPDLTDGVFYQITALDAFARAAGSEVAYVKPHGALYSAIVADEPQARAVVEAICTYDGRLSALGLVGSAWVRCASEAGLEVVSEAFADRAYDRGGYLVPRSQPRSVITELDDVVSRCLQMVSDHTITAADGTLIRTRPQSVCIHGDTPGAVRMAQAVRQALVQGGHDVEAFSSRRASR